jgi:presenilin 1
LAEGQEDGSTESALLEQPDGQAAAAAPDTRLAVLQPQAVPPQQHRGFEEEDEDDDGSMGLPDAIKLGLGDFIFYSMLVGRAAMYDMMTGEPGSWLAAEEPHCAAAMHLAARELTRHRCCPAPVTSLLLASSCAVFASFFAVIAGLVITLLLLALARKALPALPVSIALGVMFYFLTRLVMEPVIVPMALNMAYY